MVTDSENAGKDDERFNIRDPELGKKSLLEL